jgi:hypothetical protein
VNRRSEIGDCSCQNIVGVKTPIEETPTGAGDCGHMNAGHVYQQYTRGGWEKGARRNFVPSVIGDSRGQGPSTPQPPKPQIPILNQGLAFR